MGRKLNEAFFFNAADSRSACAGLTAIVPKLTRASIAVVQDDDSGWLWDKTLGDKGGLGPRLLLLVLQILDRFDNKEASTIQQLKSITLEDVYDASQNKEDGTVKNSLFLEIRDGLTILLGHGNRKIPPLPVDAGEQYFVTYASMLIRRWRLRRGLQPRRLSDQDIALVFNVWSELRQGMSSIDEAFDCVCKLIPDGTFIQAPQRDEKVKAPVCRSYVSNSFRHHLKSGFNNNHISNTELAKKKARSVLGALQTSQIAVLHGNINAGKSAIIVASIRELARLNGAGHNEEKARLALHNSKVLPLCLINLRAHSHVETALRVLAFLRLQRHENEKKNFAGVLQVVRNEFNGTDIRSDLHSVLTEIGLEHRNRPCFFIFTNFEERTSASPRTILRDQNTVPLIRALTRNNPDGRMLLSTMATTERTGIAALKRTLPGSKTIKVADPDIQQIYRYWPHLRIENVEEKRIVKKLAEGLETKKVPGTHLLIISAALQLITKGSEASPNSHQRRKLEDLLVDYTGAIKQLAKQQSAKKKEKLETALSPIIAILLSELKAQKMLRIVLAIAASDDGLRQKSLHKVMDRWGTQSDYPRRAITDLNETIASVKTLANGYFIEAIPSYNPNSALLDIGETVGPSDRQNEMNQAVRQMICCFISRQEVSMLQSKKISEQQGDLVHQLPYLLKEAHRQISVLARERSRNWRRNAPLAHLTRNWRDLLPDIQAYESFLASLDKDKVVANVALETASDHELVLLHGEKAALRQSSQYDHRQALKWCVQQLLKNEIDRKGRLGNLYGQDDLKTKLYILPFLELGRRHFMRTDELQLGRDLPETIPKHIAAVFSDLEIVEMLSAIALSAFYSQCQEILEWSVRLFQSLLIAVKPGVTELKPDPTPFLLQRGMRIECARFDMAILSGRSPEQTEKDGHYGTLEVLRSFLADNFALLEQLFAVKQHDCRDIKDLWGKIESLHHHLINSGRGIGSAHSFANGSLSTNLDRFVVIAWLRLKAREAQLLHLTDQSELSLRLFELLHGIEGVLEQCDGKSGPAVLIGQPARLHIHALLRTDIFKNPSTGRPTQHTKNAEEWLDRLFRANESRLNLFSGSAQAAALIDDAIYRSYKNPNNLSDALTQAAKAQNAVENDGSNIVTRLEILIARCHLELKSMRKGFDKHGEKVSSRALGGIRHEVKRIIRLSDHLELKPSKALGLYLRALARYVGMDRAGTLVSIQNIRADLVEAIKIMESIGDLVHLGEAKSLLADLQV